MPVATIDIGTNTTRLIVAKVSGRPFAEFLKTQFFEPLGMKDTGLRTSDAVLPHEAMGYAFSGDATKKPIGWDLATSGGAGSLYSTVVDLGRWNQALLAGEVLGRGALRPVQLGAGARQETRDARLRRGTATISIDPLGAHPHTQEVRA